jgi:galactose mutarotase-like enzyme
MQNFTIENNLLKVTINNKGAELQSLYNKATQLEYLWNGDANFWGKKSPVLFPIVGGLKNNEYEFEGKKYLLPRHGFARDNEFEVNKINETTIQFILSSCAKTQEVYPFNFKFIVEYSLNNNQLFCTYIIENTGTNKMYFSVGAHPAFAVPLNNNTHFDDWFLEFNATENCGIYPLTKEGLIKTVSTPQLNNNNALQLTKQLFYSDALVFKNLQSTSIKMKSAKSNHGLQINFKGFPYFGIWSAKDANFVCLEPWLGIADSENTTQNLIEKEGIICLVAKAIFNATWSVELY